MLRVALTGGIATGKTYVRTRLEARGIRTFDSDRVVHELLAAGTGTTSAIAKRFGAGVLREDGAVDRRALARVVFEDRLARKELERIVHPKVFERLHAWAEEAERTGVRWILADIPLLYETSRQGEFDRVVVTTCPAATQVRRMMERGGLSEAEAKARLAAQWPMAEKVRMADYVVRTAGTFAETDRQVDEIAASLDAGG